MESSYSLRDLVGVIVEKKYSIFGASFLLAFLVVLYSFIFMSEEYESNSVVKIVTENESVEISSPLIGFLPQQSASSNRKSEILETFNSRDFFRNLVENKDFRVEFDKGIGTSDSSEIELSDEVIEDLHSKFKKHLYIKSTANSNIIFLAYRSLSANSSKNILTKVVEHLNRSFQSKDLENYNKEYENLLLMLSNQQQVVVEDSISKILERLIVNINISESKDEYILEFIETPQLNSIQVFPNRKLLLLFSFLGAFFTLSLFFILRKFAW